jgi:polysaccharide biosynthesis/export protein
MTIRTHRSVLDAHVSGGDLNHLTGLQMGKIDTSMTDTHAVNTAWFFLKTIGSLGVILLLASGCASSGGNPDPLTEFQQEQASQSRVDDINQQLLSLAVEASGGNHVYRIGAGDQIRIEIFNVPELSRDYRVDGNGNINLPLVGELSLSGYDLAQAEHVVASAYGENYLRNPQVSIRVTEFRSQQFTAIGALSSPRIYNVDRRVTLMEAIAMAGGLATSAGSHVYLTDRVRDPETGELGTRSLIIGVEDLMQNPGEYNFLLGDSALINVPRAGSIFVEGAVERPGVFTRQGETTVLKAITMAGGLKFEANRSQIRVLRRNPATNEWQQEEVKMSEIRESPLADLTLEDGDIVMVEYGIMRTAWTGTLRTLRDIAFLGFRPF